VQQYTLRQVDVSLHGKFVVYKLATTPMVTQSRDITAHTNSQSETAKVGAASTNRHLQTGGQKCMEK